MNPDVRELEISFWRFWTIGPSLYMYKPALSIFYGTCMWWKIMENQNKLSSYSWPLVTHSTFGKSNYSVRERGSMKTKLFLSFLFTDVSTVPRQWLTQSGALTICLVNKFEQIWMIWQRIDTFIKYFVNIGKKQIKS